MDSLATNSVLQKALPVTSSGRLDQYRSPARGICIIIDNLPLSSSERDSEATALGDVFSGHLGFTVELNKSCSTQKIREALQHVRDYDHSQHDALVVVALSLGATCGILGTDNVEVPLKEIASYFSASQCPALTGKPKVVIFQTCKPKNNAVHALNYNYPAFTPDFVDFLFIGATVPTCQSECSFLQALATTLRVPHLKSFLDILFEVNSTCTGEQVAKVMSTLNHKLLIAPVEISGGYDMMRRDITGDEGLPGYC